MNLDTIINSCQVDKPTTDKTLHYLANIIDTNTGYWSFFQRVVSALPPLSLKDGPWLAGGSVRRLVEGYDAYNGWDFDLYFPDARTRDHFYRNLKEKFRLKPAVITNRAETYYIDFQGKHLVLQLVKYTHPNSDYAVIKDFDFTNSMLVTDGITVRTGEATLNDIQHRMLAINTLKDTWAGVSTMRRISKFMGEGYHVPNKLCSDFLCWVKYFAKIEKLQKDNVESETNSHAIIF